MTGGRGSRIKIRVENKDYHVVGGDFQRLLAAVKALPQRRFNSQLKLWEVSGSLAMVRGQLENSGFTLEGGVPASATAPADPAPPGDRVKIEAGGQVLMVTGAPFEAMLEIIKAIPGRRFDGQQKRWSVPGAPAEIKAYLAEKNLTVEMQPDQPATAAPAPDMGFAADEGSDPADDLFPASWAAGAGFDQVPAPPPDLPPPDEGYFEEVALYHDPLPAEPAAEMSGDDRALSPAPAAGSTTGRRDQIRIILENQPLLVVGGGFGEMLAAIKDIPGRRFDGESKQWLLPGDIESVQQYLAEKGFRLEKV